MQTQDVTDVILYGSLHHDTRSVSECPHVAIGDICMRNMSSYCTILYNHYYTIHHPLCCPMCQRGILHVRCLDMQIESFINTLLVCTKQVMCKSDRLFRVPNFFFLSLCTYSVLTLALYPVRICTIGLSLVVQHLLHPELLVCLCCIHF